VSIFVARIIAGKDIMIYLNAARVDATLFPDNTSQVWKIPLENFVKHTEINKIEWEFTHEGEFMQLAQLKDLIDQVGFRAELKLKYLPYGRQDKEIQNSTTFALRTFAKLLNSLNFEKVTIMDPHSETAAELIRNSSEEYPLDILEKVCQLTNADIVCYPDQGADSKYSYIYPYKSICGSKVRNQETGYIESYTLHGDPKGKNVLIVDDICDGGMTFKLLTKDLLKGGATEVNLFVTHGLFSKGLRTLFDSGIKRIFTQDGEASGYDNNISYRRI